MSLIFIGLGLNDEKGITVEGLEEARRADSAFGEFYTNIMPNLDLRRLENEIGKKIEVLSRGQLEDEGGEKLLKAASKERVAFLVPGDPLIATTHISLRLSLARMGIPSRVVHAPSIVSAVSGATGLQNYKFGKSITIPRDQSLPKSVLDTIFDNRDRGLHTLILLDVQAGKTSQMTIHDALSKMTAADARLETRMAVGIARLGSADERVTASKMKSLIDEDFGTGPHSIVVVGKLHFMEAEALEVLCGASKNDLRELT
ncbi:MAG TPA: diphthine synthase [Candidatus Angelobacter sp.]|nr:diphthine synthase [Candidatus Angelobacter sp.]